MKQLIAATIAWVVGLSLATAATITNIAPTSITATSATLSASVIATNTQLPYVRFVFGRSAQTNYDDWANARVLSGRVADLNSNVTCSVFGLTPNNKWYFSTQASEDGTNWTWAVSNNPTAFTTLSASRYPLPTVVSLQMSSNTWITVDGTNLLWIVGFVTNQFNVTPR